MSNQIYLYRWLNPGNNPYITKDELEWKILDKEHWVSWEERIKEMLAYRYAGRQVYEVRDLTPKSLKPESKKMNVDEIWNSEALMTLNAELGLTVGQLQSIIAVIEAHHGIN